MSHTPPDSRRQFLKTASTLTGAAVAGTVLSGCGAQDCSDSSVQPAAHTSQEQFEWKMVTTWPMNFPGLGTGANDLARRITEMSGGRLKVKIFGAGELIPAFETFDAVSRGTAEMGHCSAYYWKGKVEEAQFFSTVPFGLTGQEMNAWLYHGGGMELWREVYQPFGLIPFAAGNTAVQMGGWFNKPINTVEDLKGLKMRIPGLGGEVLKKLGGTPVNLPGAELFTALQTGTLDATEWVGPYNDLAFGLHKAAKHYYAPGWHEPGTTLELIVNQDAFNALPADLQSIVDSAAMATNNFMYTEFAARNPRALQTLINEHGVEPKVFPKPVIEALKQAAQEVLDELAARNEKAAQILKAYRAFLAQSRAWQDLSDVAYLQARDH